MGYIYIVKRRLFYRSQDYIFTGAMISFSLYLLLLLGSCHLTFGAIITYGLSALFDTLHQLSEHNALSISTKHGGSNDALPLYCNRYDFISSIFILRFIFAFVLTLDIHYVVMTLVDEIHNFVGSIIGLCDRSTVYPDFSNKTRRSYLRSIALQSSFSPACSHK